MNRLDRLILRGRDPDESCTRLAVERLRYMMLVSLLVAIAGAGLLFTVVQGESRNARQRTAEIVANDCVDRAGDVAFRNVLVDLTAINEGRRPADPAIARLPRQQWTAAILRTALQQAGEAPRCILHIP